MKKGVIQWFVNLLRRGMSEYEENEKDKEELYEIIKKDIETENKKFKERK